MRDAARALDDVSDHLGEVLRHADELLVEWSQFGARVRTAVDAEVAGIGEVVDGAVLRAAQSGVDRAIVDRLRGLSSEIERIEQRTRAAARAVADQRTVDRRLLWGVIAGIVLSNVLLVVLLLRKPEPVAAPVVEPVHLEVAPAPSTATPPVAAAPGEPAAEGSGSAIAAPVVPAGNDGSAARPEAGKPGAGSAAKIGAGSATKPESATARPGVLLPRPIGPHPHK